MATVAAALALLGAACSTSSSSGSPSGGSAAPTTVDPIDAPASGGGERAVQFNGPGNVHLAATFATAPGGPQVRLPGALLLPSLGPGDRNGPMTPTGEPDRLAQDLSKALVGGGVATLRYDRRGTGESKLAATPIDGGAATFTYDDVVADAKAGLDLLAQRKETAGGRYAVVAYGSGSLVALRLAATDARVSRVVLVSAPGRALVDVQADLFSAVAGADTGPALRTAVAGLLASGTLPAADVLPAALRPFLPQAEAGFLAQVYKLDPLAEAAGVKVPVLLVVGARAAGATAADAARLQSAMVATKVDVATAVNSNDLIAQVNPPPADDPGDFNSPNHEHGAPIAVDPGTRDPDTLTNLTNWLRTGLTG